MRKTFSLIGLISIIYFSCDDIGINESPNKKQGFLHSFGTSWYEYGWGVTQLHDGGFVVIGRKE